MNDKKILLLVNFNYDDEAPGHVIFEIPENRVTDAHRCVNRAYNAWYDNEEDLSKTIEEFIEDEFKIDGIAYEIRDYSVTDCDLSNY